MQKLRPISTPNWQRPAESPSMERPSVGRLPELRLQAISAPPVPVSLSRVQPIQPSKAPRVLGFDLENRPLAYWYDGQTTSEITAFGWKFTDESDVHTMMLTADGSFVLPGGVHLSDVEAYTHFRNVLLTENTVVFGHNIRKHDLPIVQAGLLRRQLPPLEPIRNTDTLRDIPKKNGLSASLANLSAMYGLEGEKQSMSHSDWELSNRLTKEGIDLARGRVVGDVLLQEQLRAKLLDLNLLRAPRMWNP